MRRRSSFYTCVLATSLLIFALKPTPGMATPSVSADSAVLLDAASGEVLWSKNSRQARPPASTTKIVTALVGLNLGQWYGIVRISPEAARTGESTINLRAGEEIALRHLVEGALVRSGNDAATAIAEHTAGAVSLFSVLMNRQMLTAGGQCSSLLNPHGLPARGHLTSAYDLAMVARYAMENPVFASITAQKSVLIPGPADDWQRRLRNTNQLLWSYPGADGVKTGTTNEAGKCLVASASREGQRLIAVVLHSDDRYSDTTRLLDYGFATFASREVPKGASRGEIPVSRGEKPVVGAVTGTQIAYAAVRKDLGEIREKVSLLPEITAPVAPGQQLGTLEIVLRGQVLDSAPLVASEAIPSRPFSSRLKAIFRHPWPPAS